MKVAIRMTATKIAAQTPMQRMSALAMGFLAYHVRFLYANLAKCGKLWYNNSINEEWRDVRCRCRS